MNKSMKIAAVCVALFILLFVEFVAPLSDGCTGVYVGKDATTDGSIIIARSDDYAKVAPFYLDVVKRVENTPGRTYDGSNGFSYPLPDTTFRYVATPESYTQYDGWFEVSAMNEYGLAVTATVTTYPSKEAISADKYILDGVEESVITGIVASCCKTAHEAIELVADIVDVYGSSQSNSMLVTDQNETWFMEMYTGHQYCAVRAPTDKVAGYGNECMLESIEGYDENDVICSDDLFTLPEEKGFAKYTESGYLDLVKTYGAKRVDAAHGRTWRLHQLMSPSTIGDYSADVEAPLFFLADEEISVIDVMNYYRDRYEGTKYEGSNMRPISTETSGTVHITQVFPDAPAGMDGINWVSMGCAKFITFVPIVSSVNSVSPEYCDVPTYYQYDSAYFTFKKLNTLCEQFQYSDDVINYWKTFEERYVPAFYAAYEKALEMYKDSPSKAAEYITKVCTLYQEQMLSEAKRLVGDVEWNMMNNLGPQRSVPIAFEPMIDAKLVAEQCGWKSSMDGDNFVFEKEGKKITIVPSAEVKDAKGKIIIGEETKDINTRISWDTILIPFACLDSFGDMTSDSYLNWVDSQNSVNGANDNNIGIIVTIVVVAMLILVVTVAFALKKRH